MIDIDEIKLAPDRTGSARAIRFGKKRAKDFLEKARARPRWKRQLRSGRPRYTVVTLAQYAGDK